MQKLVKDYQTYSSFIELIQDRVDQHPDRIAYTFLNYNGNPPETITYKNLELGAKSIAAHLQQRTSAGKRALLIFPSGLDYIKAFLGCLYAGVIAVPVYPPTMSRNFLRLQSIIRDSNTEIIITTNRIRERIESHLTNDSRTNHLIWLTIDGLKDSAHEWSKIKLDHNSLAFLQYTSGSTSSPKGVMVSHGNLLHNEWMLQTASGNHERTIQLGWLPFYHDMGLIGNVLHALYIGSTYIFMSPTDFLQRPYRWLEAITKYRATVSGGPNFAYDLCLRKITDEQMSTLDLSSWEIAFNGAEPVRSETIERFSEKFADCGFRKEAFWPCYGLAEGTLLVTSVRKSEMPKYLTVDKRKLELNEVVEVTENTKDALTIVSCGQSWCDEKVLIVDPETFEECPSNRVGEIWVKSSSVAKGYWNRHEDTKTFFQACLASGEGEFLRTGDLGFIKDGELYVTGRLKDVIVIRGRNYYPNDIEFIVEQTDPAAINTGSSAAFSVEVGTEEKLVIVAELNRAYRPRRTDDNQDTIKKLLTKIRERVMDEFQVQPHAILLIKTGTIPKTSSGKIQRFACKQAFLKNEFEIWGRS